MKKLLASIAIITLFSFKANPTDKEWVYKFNDQNNTNLKTFLMDSYNYIVAEQQTKGVGSPEKSNEIIQKLAWIMNETNNQSSIQNQPPKPEDKKK